MRIGLHPTREGWLLLNGVVLVGVALRTLHPSTRVRAVLGADGDSLDAKGWFFLPGDHRRATRLSEGSDCGLSRGHRLVA